MGRTLNRLSKAAVKRAAEKAGWEFVEQPDGATLTDRLGNSYPFHTKAAPMPVHRMVEYCRFALALCRDYGIEPEKFEPPPREAP